MIKAPDVTLLYVMFAFIVSYALMKRYIFTPLGDILERREEEVRGPGVVGEQPVLAPGGAFEYTSGCPLPTPFGSMRGTYQMVTAGGETFDAAIAPFALTEPHALH